MMMAVVCILIIMLAWIIGKVYHDTLVIKWLRKHRGPLTIVATLLVIFSQSRDLRYTVFMMWTILVLLMGIVMTVYDFQKRRAALK
ncbi:hypothetical protein AUQ39_08260 [Lacticaseibacillus casei]|nr:hypothetical protein HMPREF2861_02150 [Lactobacillus sp. HMSC068F07]OLS08076.1 hypothetical protein AUQ39_08260 [Lacticaseibacillus casei]